MMQLVVIYISLRKVNKMKKFYLSLIFIFLISSINATYAYGNNDKKIEKLIKIKTRFKGKKLEAIDSIIKKSENGDKSHVVFLFTGYDCGNCVTKGIELAQFVDNMNKKKTVDIIASNANVNQYQLQTGYEHYIHTDNEEIIRKELKFIFTPVFFLLDDNNIIIDMYFPLPEGDEKWQDDFLVNVIKTF